FRSWSRMSFARRASAPVGRGTIARATVGGRRAKVSASRGIPLEDRTSATRAGERDARRRGRAEGRACENPVVPHYDAVVVGAGPAGSTTAFRLAAAGARTLLLDRARFPRDKPCAGGVSVRALRQLPFGIDPVVEEVVHGVE